mmetsp:Transcript_5178/g.13091  ORF Transcript_5178/g.13091 Transcript_5178/m.13091 type:complete len:81 (+) Transcript_5178:194-436(+)
MQRSSASAQTDPVLGSPVEVFNTLHSPRTSKHAWAASFWLCRRTSTTKTHTTNGRRARGKRHQKQAQMAHSHTTTMSPAM